MKSLTINTGAAWVATLETYQDGDVFRESNIDLQAASVANHLGYLKTAVDGKASLSGPTFNTDSADFTVEGAGDAIFDSALIANAGVALNNDVTVNAPAAFLAGVSLSVVTVADAAATIDAAVTQNRVPVITAARIYTLPATTGLVDGHLVLVTRPGTAAFTVTVNDPTGPTTMGVIPDSQAGWILCVKRSTSWRVAAWHVNTTSLHATV